MEFPLFWIVLFVFVVVVIKGLVIVQQYEKGVIETLGSYTKTLSSGPHWIFPFMQGVKKVDMREQVLDVPPQDVITKDNAVVLVDAIIYIRVTDPFKAIYNVQDFYVATINLAQTTLRNIVGDMDLDSTLTSRDSINGELRLKLDDATDSWGIKVTRVELKAIEPPRDITDSMSKQMKAEREKRAAILDAEGVRQSQILKAEGEKQSAILRAEGQRQSVILAAEAEAEAMRQVAEAKRFEIETVYGAIHQGNPTSDLLAVKYLEALQKIAEGPANKLFIPYEASGVLGAMGGIAEAMKNKK